MKKQLHPSSADEEDPEEEEEERQMDIAVDRYIG
jgi:hypothetical protein